MTAIPPVFSDEALEICGRIGDNKAAGLDGVPNRALILAVKSRPDMLAEFFEAYNSGDISYTMKVTEVSPTAKGW